MSASCAVRSLPVVAKATRPATTPSRVSVARNKPLLIEQAPFDFVAADVPLVPLVALGFVIARGESRRPVLNHLQGLPPTNRASQAAFNPIKVFSWHSAVEMPPVLTPMRRRAVNRRALDSVPPVDAPRTILPYVRRRPCRALAKVVRNTGRGPRRSVFFSATSSEARPALLTYEVVPKILQATLQSLPVVVDDISHARSPLIAREVRRAGSVGRCGAVRQSCAGGAPQCAAGPTDPRARVKQERRPRQRGLPAHESASR